MNDREKLIELIDDALAVYDVIVYARLHADEIADCLIANGVTIQKHGRCDMCSIGVTGTGSIGLYGHGWQVCIRKQGWTYDLVINHCGEQIAIPIDYCPNCGAEMGKENADD